jgi:hypothetical protein
MPRFSVIGSAEPITLSQLESHLWEAANTLRGPVDAADFKTYIFPLLFFKRISDAVHTDKRGAQHRRAIGPTRQPLVVGEGAHVSLMHPTAGATDTAIAAAALEAPHTAIQEAHAAPSASWRRYSSGS